jgi:amino acid transporter
MFAVSRIIAAVARQRLLPPVLASVHSRFGTPWVATLCAGLATALIALFTGEGFAGLLFMPSPNKLLFHSVD